MNIQNNVANFECFKFKAKLRASNSADSQMTISGMIILIISNKEKDDFMKIVKSLKESSLLIRDVIETIEIKTKEQKGVFLSVLFGTIRASLLRNLLTDYAKLFS